MASPEALDFLLTRRSCPPKLFHAPGPDRAELMQILTAAVRVPDHGKLEPWRLIVLQGAGKTRFSAEIRARAEAAGLDADKGALAFEQAEATVAVVAAPKISDKIPAIEQTLSAGAVALSLLNAALAAGWGAAWLTGWPAYDRPPRSTSNGSAAHPPRHSATPRFPERPRPDLAALVTWVED